MSRQSGIPHKTLEERRMSTSITSRGVALIAAAAVSLLAAFAMASQADAATLYACVKKEGGSMRLVSQHAKCTKSERKVGWSTTGPAGKNGANGAAGAGGKNGSNGSNGSNGNNGANGSALGLYAFKDGPVALASVATEQTVATLANVPPGKYLFNAKAEVEGGTLNLQLHCRLTAQGDFDESDALLAKTNEAASIETLPFIVSHEFTTTGSVVLGCNTFGVANVKVRNIKITGTLLQTLTASNG
jgi:hypothetical protein